MHAVLATGIMVALASAHAVGATEKQSVPMHFRVPVKRPILCTVKAKIEGAMAVGAGEAAQKMPMTMQSECVLVDEYLAFGETKEKATRYFVKVFRTVNGQIADPPLNGLDLVYERTGKELNLTLKDDRMLPDPILKQQIRSFRSLGVWLAFPKEAVLGTTYKFDFADLAPFFASGDVPIAGAQGHLRFESYDAVSGIAVFKGPVAIVEKGKVEDRELAAEYAMDECTIRVKPGARQILSASLAGKVAIKEKRGEETSTFAGTGSFELTTEVGAAAAKARAQKPTFRDCVHLIPDAGVQVALPSHYGEVKQEDGGKRFGRGIEGNKGEASIIIQLAQGSSSNPAAFYDGMLAELKKADKNVKAEKATSPLGAGRAFLFASSDGKKKLRVRGEFYPTPKGFVLFKLLAEPDAFVAAGPEFAKARASLKAADLVKKP